MMKKGVVIVNTARGAVMDEEALVEALDNGHVASCGLDVYEHEPKIHPSLVANPRVMLVPHMGTWTIEVSGHCLFLILHVWGRVPSDAVRTERCNPRSKNVRPCGIYFTPN